MADYDLYADGYIGRCFRLYNWSDPELGIDLTYNTLKINAIPYDFLGKQSFEIEFYFYSAYGIPIILSIGDDYPYSIRYIVIRPDFIYIDYLAQNYWDLDIPLSEWNKIKIKYLNGRWDIYLNDVLLIPDGYSDLTISTIVNTISFQMRLDDTGYPVGVDHKLIDEIKINPSVLVADFVAIGSTSVDVSESITFQNNSSGDIDTYAWTFGVDAVPLTSATSGNPVVYWTSYGLKTISLTITGPGGSNTKTRTNYIYIVIPPS